MRYSYVPIPLTEEGNGPAAFLETVRTEHQVWDMTDNSTVCTCPSPEIAERVARMLSVADLVDFFFSPWGAYKAAKWEDISGDRGPLDPNGMLKYMKEKLDG